MMINGAKRICGDVCTGLVIIWNAINHKTSADQNQSSKHVLIKINHKTCADQKQTSEVFVFHNPHFLFYLRSHKNK